MVVVCTSVGSCKLIIRQDCAKCVRMYVSILLHYVLCGFAQVLLVHTVTSCHTVSVWSVKSYSSYVQY